MNWEEHRMTVRVLSVPTALCALAFLLVGGAAAQGKLHDGWYQIAMADMRGAFSFQMPQEPKFQPMKNAPGAGRKYTTLVWSTQFDDGAYEARMFVLPPDVDVMNPRRNLQMILDSDAALLKGGKFASFDWKEGQGLTEVDAVGRTADGRDMRVHSAIKGSRGFTLTYIGRAGSTRSADVNRFIASVRFHSGEGDSTAVPQAPGRKP
jgi:hypothetical protein